VLLDLGTNKQPSEPKHTNTHSGNLHGLLPVMHQSDRWLAPVRPVTPVRPVDRAGQAGGYSSRTTSVLESLSDISRSWIKNTPKTQPAQKENHTQSLAKQLQIDQELTSSTTTQRHTSQAVHPRKMPQVAYTGQTGHAHWSDWSSADIPRTRWPASSPSSRGVTRSCFSTPSSPRVHLPRPHQEL
jgi:hypothetical protein